MPSNPLKKILERRREASGSTSEEEALEKLNREVQESKDTVRQRNEKLARDYFGSSIEALKRQLEESRTALEGLPEQVPDGQDEAFRKLIGELMESYSIVEKALDEAGENPPDSDAGEPGDAEAPDAAREEEDGVEEATAEDEGADEDSGVLVEGVAEEVAERVLDGQGGAGQSIQASDTARRKAEELGLDLSEIEGTGQGGAITVRDVTGAAEPIEGRGDVPLGQIVEEAGDMPVRVLGGDGQAADGEEEEVAGSNGRATAGDKESDEGPKATNAARRKAEELGINLTGLRGSGANGLVTIQDVVKP